MISSILSNSSIQQIPLSDKTNAPDSNITSLVSGSLDILAVKPTADDPLPDVYIDLGATLCEYCNNCDFAVDGSPTNNIFISDLVLA